MMKKFKVEKNLVRGESKIEHKKYLNMLLNYYKQNVEKVAEILGVKECDIPKGVKIILKKGSRTYYNKKKKLIMYGFEIEDDIVKDKGKLIHEITHVIQDYPEGIDSYHSCWCWMEGIADYCRAILDCEFDINENLSGHPLNGYRDTAHFLFWLTEKYKNIIPKLNNFLKNNCSNIDEDVNFIFKNLVKKEYSILLKEYYQDYKELFKDISAKDRKIF